MSRGILSPEEKLLLLERRYCAMEGSLLPLQRQKFDTGDPRQEWKGSNTKEIPYGRPVQ